ncbi:MAG TPA: alpha/beta hydrolase [Polyangiales bacterium]|nr:alpha/beta hydrolase [Polyangiales bacterium]
MKVQASTRQVRGIATVIHASGQPGPEAIVFVHGNPSSGLDWSELLAAAGELAYSVAPDMPNYGRSERPPQFECSVEGYASHLTAVIDQLGIRRAHLVLHDFGGPWGLTWAAAHLDQVASVTLINVGMVPGYRWHKYARIWQTPILGELFMACATPATARMLLNLENPRPFPEAFVQNVLQNLDAESKRAQLALYRATRDLAALSEQLGRQLAPSKIPALVVWGEDDRNMPARYAAVQSQYFAVSATHVLPGCGHWPFVDEPEKCRALLLPFLRQQLLGAAA